MAALLAVGRRGVFTCLQECLDGSAILWLFSAFRGFFLDVFTDVRFSEPQAFQSDAGLRTQRKPGVYVG